MVDIWVPKTILEPKDPVTMMGRVEGRVRLQVIKPGIKGVKHDTGWFPNMILDSGLDNLGIAAGRSLISAADRCHVGTSNTAPSAGQTSLISRIAGTTNTFSPSATFAVEGTYGVDACRVVTLYRQFDEGTAAGVLREIGFGLSGDTNGTNLTSRALITDGAGNPTDVTVLSDEILQVSYQLRFYFPTSDITGTMNMSGVPYGYTIRVPSISGTTSGSPFVSTYDGSATIQVRSGGTFGAIGVDQVGGSTASAASASAPSGSYTPGNHYIDVSSSSSLSQGNVTGGSFDQILFSASSSSGPRYKILLDAPIAKDNTKLMTLNFRLGWGRK